MLCEKNLPGATACYNLSLHISVTPIGHGLKSIIESPFVELNQLSNKVMSGESCFVLQKESR